MGHPATAIRVGDGFLLANYPNPKTGKQYSTQNAKGATRAFPLDEGWEKALLFRLVEQILGGDMIGSRW